MSIGVWTKQGTAIAQSSDSPRWPSVIYEGNAQILSGTVFKMWFGTGAGVLYAESIDGISWTRYGSNPVISIAAEVFPKVFKHGSTYYCYVGPVAGPIAVYTSADGIAWTLQNASALTTVAATWESLYILSLNVGLVDGAGTWWGYYTATVQPQFVGWSM